MNNLILTGLKNFARSAQVKEPIRVLVRSGDTDKVAH